MVIIKKLKIVVIVQI